MSYGYSPNYPPARYDDGYAAAPSRRSAPPSVHVVALIQYLCGLALIAVGAGAGAFSLGFGRAIDQSGFGPAVVDLRGIGLAAGAVFVLAGLLALAIGRRLQRGRQWARALVCVLAVVSITVTLYNGLVGQGEANALFGLVFPVMYLVLLNLPAARSWFRSRAY